MRTNKRETTTGTTGTVAVTGRIHTLARAKPVQARLPRTHVSTSGRNCHASTQMGKMDLIFHYAGYQGGVEHSFDRTIVPFLVGSAERMVPKQRVREEVAELKEMEKALRRHLKREIGLILGTDRPIAFLPGEREGQEDGEAMEPATQVQRSIIQKIGEALRGFDVAIEATEHAMDVEWAGCDWLDQHWKRNDARRYVRRLKRWMRNNGTLLLDKMEIVARPTGETDRPIGVASRRQDTNIENRGGAWRVERITARDPVP